MTQPPEPVVTAIIPAFNAERYIADAIESALGQKDCTCHVIVVDDGSTDRTAAVVHGFGSRVRLITQPNSGVAAARNAGLRAADTPFVAFLDADDAWLQEKTARQLELFVSDSDCVAAGCGCYVADDDLQVIKAQTVTQTTYEDHILWRSTGGLNGSGLLVRTEAIRRAGGYDERLSTSADWDLALRLLVLGRTRSVGEPLFLYRQHGSNMHGGIRVMERDMRHLLKKARAATPLGRQLYRAAMAETWSVLAGSYWHAGHPIDAIRCGLRAFATAPMRAPGLAMRSAKAMAGGRRTRDE